PDPTRSVVVRKNAPIARGSGPKVLLCVCVGRGQLSGMFEMNVNVQGHEAIDVEVLRGGCHEGIDSTPMTRDEGTGAYSSSTSATRLCRTAFWLSEPLSVVSRASVGGGSSG